MARASSRPSEAPADEAHPVQPAAFLRLPMRLFSNRARPPHLGKYPMEKIRRVARPTTRIAADVPRQPKRANFFNRAMAGDLGAKAKRERARFVNKIPAARAMGRMCHQHLSLHDGAAKPEEAPLPDDLAARAEHIKSLCYFMGNRPSPDFATRERYRTTMNARQTRRSRPVSFQARPMSISWHQPLPES